MAQNALTLMDVMPSAMDRINMDQAAQQQLQRNQYQAAVLQQAQQQAQAQNALTVGQQNATPTPTNALNPPAQGAQIPAQPQGQNALNQRQRPGQVPVPQNYAEAVAMREQAQRDQARQAQQFTEAKQVQTFFQPAIDQAISNENPTLLNAYADAAEKMAPGNSMVKQAADIMRNNKVAKGVITVSSTPVTDPNYAKVQFTQNKDYLQSMGIMTPQELEGKDISFDQDIKTRAQLPGTLRIVPKSKEEQALQLSEKKADVASALEMQKEGARESLETQKEAARVREDEKKQRAADQRFEAQQRQAERRQEHSDRRFAQGIQLREYNASAMPAKTALGTAYRTSNAAAGFENRIKANVAILNNWMDAYAKKHPGAANRTGAVFNDLINGEITGEGDLSNIETAAASVGFELGKLEVGSYGTAEVSKNATDHFNRLKTAKGLDNMKTQLNGIIHLAETAKRAQDTVTEQAEDTFNDVRSQYGLPPVGKAGKKLGETTPAKASAYRIGAPYKAPGQNTKQIIGVHREGGKVTKLMLSDKSVVEVP